MKIEIPLSTANLVISRIIEGSDRDKVFEEARAKADELDLPLVNYGCSYMEPYVSRSDYNLDVEPRDVPNFVLVERGGRLPFPDGGAVVYASHVLEHVDDPWGTLEEWGRVGPTYIVIPRWWNLSNWVHRGHKRLFIGDYVLENTSSWATPLVVGSLLWKFL